MANILRLSLQKDPLTLDPQKSGDKFSSAIIFLLFKGLTRLEPDRKVCCDLATSFQVLNNYKQYVFHLGEHFWSDGNPITAHDFVYSWKRALSPDFPLRATNFFYYLKNAEKAKKGVVSIDKVKVYATDDLTLVVELEYPCPYFLELASFCPLFPVSPRVKENEIFSICSGPFQLHDWRKDKVILLKKNPMNANFESVHLDEIHIRIISDSKEAFDLFEKGELDWIGDPISPLPVNYLPELLWKKKMTPIAGLVSCWFNTLIPPFNNVKLRQAFGHAIPRERILEKLLLPNTASAESFYPSFLQNRNKSFSPQECCTTTVALFEQALKELKRKRLKITLSYEAVNEFSHLAKILKAFWEETFNVFIQLEPLNFKELLQRLPQREFEMSLFGSHSQYTDIINFLERFEFKSIPRNFSGWENYQYKSLLQKYRTTVNEEKRQALAKKAEDLLFREMPIAPIYSYHFTYLQKAYVKNLAISPIGVMQFDRVLLYRK